MRRNKISSIAAAAVLFVAGCSTDKESSSTTVPVTDDVEVPATQVPEGSLERHFVIVECDDGGKYELRTEGVKGLEFPDGASSASISGQGMPAELNPRLMILDDMERSLSSMNSPGIERNTPVNTYGVYVAGDNALEFPDGVAAVGYVPLVTAEQVQNYVFSNGDRGWDIEMLRSFTKAGATVSGLNSSEVVLATPAQDYKEVKLKPNKPVTAEFDLDFAYGVYGLPTETPLGKHECSFTLGLGMPA